MVLNKPLESIQESDLQALVDNQVTERKTIEYKEALPGNADGDKTAGALYSCVNTLPERTGRDITIRVTSIRQISSCSGEEMR
jgi:hypothetical protein